MEFYKKIKKTKKTRLTNFKTMNCECLPFRNDFSSRSWAIFSSLVSCMVNHGKRDKKLQQLFLLGNLKLSVNVRKTLKLCWKMLFQIYQTKVVKALMPYSKLGAQWTVFQFSHYQKIHFCSKVIIARFDWNSHVPFWKEIFGTVLWSDDTKIKLFS